MATRIKFAEPGDLADPIGVDPIGTRIDRQLCRGRLRDGGTVLIEIHPGPAPGATAADDFEAALRRAVDDVVHPNTVRVLGGGRTHDGRYITILDDPGTEALALTAGDDVEAIVAEVASAMAWLDHHRPVAPRLSRGWLRRDRDGRVLVVDSGLAPHPVGPVTVDPDLLDHDERFLAPELLTATGAGRPERLPGPAVVYSLAAAIVDVCHDEASTTTAIDNLADALSDRPDDRPVLADLAEIGGRRSRGAGTAGPLPPPQAGIRPEPQRPIPDREHRQRLTTLGLFIAMVLIAASVGWVFASRSNDGDAASTPASSTGSSTAPTTTAAPPTTSTPAPTTTAPPLTTAPLETAAPTTTAAPAPTTLPTPVAPIVGYRLVSSSGETVDVGAIIQPAVPIDPDPAPPPPPSGSDARVIGGVDLGADVWIVRADGAIDLVVGAPGGPTTSLESVELADGDQVVAIAPAPDGAWALTGSGTIVALGQAPRLIGDAPAVAGRILVDLVPSGDGGLFVIDSSGGVQSVGTERSVVGIELPDGARRIVAAARPAAATAGLWLVDELGNVIVLGDAPPIPSLPDLVDQPLQAPIVDALATSSGAGLWLVGADGGVFALGEATFFGSGRATGSPIVGVIAPD